MNIDTAAATVKQFKQELAAMKVLFKDGDQMPGEVFFKFMDVLVPAFDALITEVEKCKKEKDVSK